MKKGIFLSLTAFLVGFVSPLYGYQDTYDSNYFFADLLIWNVRAGSVENWAQEISPAGATQTAKLLNIPFKWKPGIRLGVGHNSCYDDWDAVFSYTGFQTKGTNQASVTSGGIFSPFLGNFFMDNANGAAFGANYRNASIQWKILFNIADLEAGKTFQVARSLKLRPFVGLKGGVINHHIDSSWQNPTAPKSFTSATENLKNDFWGIGPAIGLDTTWSIYQVPTGCFNFIGNFSGALLSGHWRFKDYFQNNTGASVAVQLSPITGAASMARGLLGIEWVGSIADANVSIRLGYEAQVWFDQIQYYSLNMGRLNSLMSVQGAVLGFNVKF